MGRGGTERLSSVTGRGKANIIYGTFSSEGCNETQESSLSPSLCSQMQEQREVFGYFKGLEKRGIATPTPKSLWYISLSLTSLLAFKHFIQTLTRAGSIRVVRSRSVVPVLTHAFPGTRQWSVAVGRAQMAGVISHRYFKETRGTS